MEFCEKLRMLRKNKGLTQEELAEILYVSRTAVSKWESGKGYPEINTLRKLAELFQVTVDELISSEKLLNIAEKENKANMQNMYCLLFFLADICSLVLMLFPLYPNPVEGHIYCVNLLEYVKVSAFNTIVYWIVFSLVVAVGVAGLLLIKLKVKKGVKSLKVISVILSIIAVLLLCISREAYAAAVAVMLLVSKGVTIIKSVKSDN